MRACLYIYSFLFVQLCLAQNINLIRNGGFEDTLYCDAVISSPIEEMKYWYSATDAHTDALHNCNNVLYPGLIDFTKSHSGIGRIAPVIYYDNNTIYQYRSYPATNFSDTLIANKKYCLSFYTMPSKFGNYGCNSIGAHFGVGHQYYNTSNIPPIVPQSNLPLSTVLTDTSSWYHYSDLYTATGGETDIVIGNFTPDVNLITPIINSLGLGNAIFVIDDVSLHEMSVNIGNDTTICAGTSLTIGEVNLDTAFNGYYWYHNGVLIDSLIDQKTINIIQADSFVLEKRLPCGSVFDTININIRHNCILPETEFIIPNVFSPNGDGINEVWKVELGSKALQSCIIYNRWGVLVYKSEIKNLPSKIITWDGYTTSGVASSDGVYYYVLEVKNDKDEVEKFRGYITLLR